LSSRDSHYLRVVDRVIDQREKSARNKKYHDDPVLWAKEIGGFFLWSKQREVAYAVATEHSVACAASHGVGKSFLAAVLVCWWVHTRYPDVFVATTAPSTHQVGAILWREIRNIKRVLDERYAKGLIDSPLPGYITANNEWKLDDGTVIGFGRRPPEEKEGDAMQGIHARHVLAVGDEAVGLTEEMIQSLYNITTNANSRRLLIANPTNPASYMGKIFKDKIGVWKRFKISHFDLPWFTDELKDVPEIVLEKLSEADYAKNMAEEFGKDSARYKSRVLGEFAFDADDTLITDADISVAISKEIELSSDSRPILGVDVARFGADSTVVYENRDGVVRFVDSWNNASTTETASRIHRIALERGAVEVRVDAIGLGAGVVDQLQIMEGRNYWLYGMDSAASSPNRLQWHNSRAYWWDNVRSKMRRGDIDLDPSDETVQDELCAPKYKFNQGTGGLVIESKDDMKKRGLKSPDFADAFIFAACDLVPPSNNPLDKLNKGDKVFADAADILGEVPDYLDVMDWVWND
jgi:hypothetical protein